MTKETRQLFKHLLTNSPLTWLGNGSVYQVIITTRYDARLRISIEANGSFEILRTHDTLGMVMDSGSQFTKTSGLKGHQDKIDAELVKKLWAYVDEKVKSIYGIEIDTITGKSTNYY